MGSRARAEAGAMTTAVQSEPRVAYRACPLCDALEFSTLGEVSCARHPLWRPPLPATLRWVGCRACGHVFTDGHWTAAGLAELFSRAHRHQTPGHDVELARRLCARTVARVAELRGALDGRWLDVGFGDGALMTTAAEHGFDVVGIDRRGEAVARLRAFGFDAREGELDDLPEGERFDVVSLCDVLEHIAFPRNALARARRLVASGGLLLVSTPNMESFAWRHLDDRGENPYWSELEHHHNFGRNRLYALLDVSGFAPCHFAISERYRCGMEVIARAV